MKFLNKYLFLIIIFIFASAFIFKVYKKNIIYSTDLLNNSQFKLVIKNYTWLSFLDLIGIKTNSKTKNNQNLVLNKKISYDYVFLTIYVKEKIVSCETTIKGSIEKQFLNFDIDSAIERTKKTLTSDKKKYLIKNIKEAYILVSFLYNKKEIEINKKSSFDRKSVSIDNGKKSSFFIKDYITISNLSNEDLLKNLCLKNGDENDCYKNKKNKFYTYDTIVF